MASYGFGNNNVGWKESRKNKLAEILKGLLQDMEGEGKFIGLIQGQKPYVQIDEPSRGVTIMNITYLTREFQLELIERADKKYADVMTGTEGDSNDYVLSKNV
ncbi:MAG TPA: hypothetical protein VE548_15485 [Nitrososphaeraceae archaeon]|jgi:hypothetical protein|nr:hypothetical protein [Nitrososphaeraceae archaeon]